MYRNQLYTQRHPLTVSLGNSLIHSQAKQSISSSCARTSMFTSGFKATPLETGKARTKALYTNSGIVCSDWLMRFLLEQKIQRPLPYCSITLSDSGCCDTYMNRQVVYVGMVVDVCMQKYKLKLELYIPCKAENQWNRLPMGNCQLYTMWD